MSNEKLSSEQLDDVMIDSLVLGNILIEKFETMQKHGLVMHRAKQSVTHAITHLDNYVSKIFSDGDMKGRDTLLAGNIILIKQEKIEKALEEKEIIIISDRQQTLKEILSEHIEDENVIDEILGKVKISEILKF